MKNLNYLMDRSYSVSDIQDYFERILKKHASLSGRMTTLYNRKNNSDVNLHHKYFFWWGWGFSSTGC